MATFAFFLPSQGRNTVVIWCERGIMSPPWNRDHSSSHASIILLLDYLNHQLNLISSWIFLLT